MINVSVKKRLGTFYLDSTLSDSGFICLTGRNGSGKSTLLKLISGLMRPDEGYVRVDSKDITNLPIEERGVVLVTPESYFPHFQVSSHLVWGARTRKIAIEGMYVQNVREMLGINYDGKMDKLSLGMRARVSLATALLSRPRLILVDETFSSIDNRGEFIRSYSQLARGKSEVLFTSQQADEDSKLADHLYTIEEGKTKKQF
ncbi:MAG TPA: ATP-binding cassette domain-containing protein [Nitrososphaerales archaeon]|nr:ATP-binding cassette domain-containing protein [Nitrososphaerales archaeon]